jgi:hypothetical protein
VPIARRLGICPATVPCMGSLAARSLPVVTFLLLAGITGCAGAGHEDLFEEAPNGTDGSESRATATDGTDPAAPSVPPRAPGTGPAKEGVAPPSGSAPAGSAPTTTPPATPPAQDAPPAQDPPPAQACTPEAEPNNTPLNATVFGNRLCGKIDTSNDSDFLSFVVPAGAQHISYTSVSQGGGIKVSFYDNGGSVDDDDLEPVPGKTYYVRVVRNGGNSNSRPSYELNVQFQ